MATIVCDYCGATLTLTQKYCRGCGHKNDLAFTAANAVNPVLPIGVIPGTTPPEKPTEDEINAARTSLTNPYAEWGTLVCDDGAKRMWKEGAIQSGIRRLVSSDSYNGTVANYTGNALCISNPSSNSSIVEFPALISTCSTSLSDFTFQAHMKCRARFNSGSFFGLVFRSDSTGGTCYRLDITYKGGTSDAKLWAFLKNNGTFLGEKKLDDTPRNEALLAVVAQGTNIDVYIDLVHVLHVNDYLLSSGAVGIHAHGKDLVIVTHTRVWEMKRK